MSDAMWTLVAMLCHRVSTYPHLCESFAKGPRKVIPDCEGDRTYWEDVRRNVNGVWEMYMWKRNNGQQIGRDDLPKWIFRHAASLGVDPATPSTDSLVIRCFKASAAKGHATSQALGQSSWKGKLGGAAGIANGSALVNAEKGRKKNIENHSILNSLQWPAIQAGALEHDREHNTVGKHMQEEPDYSELDIGRIVRYEKHTLERTWGQVAIVFGGNGGEIASRYNDFRDNTRWEGKKFPLGHGLHSKTEIANGRYLPG